MCFPGCANMNAHSQPSQRQSCLARKPMCSPPRATPSKMPASPPHSPPDQSNGGVRGRPAPSRLGGRWAGSHTVSVGAFGRCVVARDVAAACGSHIITVINRWHHRPTSPYQGGQIWPTQNGQVGAPLPAYGRHGDDSALVAARSARVADGHAKRLPADAWRGSRSLLLGRRGTEPTTTDPIWSLALIAGRIGWPGA